MEEDKDFNLRVVEHYMKYGNVFKATREFKIGKKKVRQILTDSGVPPKKLVKKPYGNRTVQIGDKFGRWTVIGDLVNEQDRYLIPCQCECGNTGLVRESFLLSEKYNGCKKCLHQNNYPTFRKSSANPDVNLKGLSPAWASSINNNLQRGLYRTLTSEITSFDLLAQLEKQNSKCAYTGEPLNVLGFSKLKSNASVDRIDSSRDYTLNNVHWVLKSINLMKNAFSNEEFINLCSKVHIFTHGNPEPSSSNVNSVDEKVQRLIGEDDNQ